jgi:hypothetical protein
MPFLRAATRNMSPKPSVQSNDFKLKRVLFFRGNHGDFFNTIGQKQSLSNDCFGNLHRVPAYPRSY